MLPRSLKFAVFVTALGVAGPRALAQVHVELPSVEIHVSHGAPPAVRHEHRPPRPAADYVWVPGAWDWQGSNWVWVGGRWEQPAYEHAHWIAPRYHRDGDHWHYEPGHWDRQRVVQGDEYRRYHEEHGRGNHERENEREHEHEHEHQQR